MGCRCLDFGIRETGGSVLYYSQGIQLPLWLVTSGSKDCIVVTGMHWDRVGCCMGTCGTQTLKKHRRNGALLWTLRTGGRKKEATSSGQAFPSPKCAARATQELTQDDGRSIDFNWLFCHTSKSGWVRLP